MSNYYEYREVKVMIARELEKLADWKVFGHKPDNSDPYTDYYDPEDWSGLAEKNGYILVVNKLWEEKPREVWAYASDLETGEYGKLTEKIAKLEQMTVDRGASESEAETAKRMIRQLEDKMQSAIIEHEKSRKFAYTIPGHMANPTRCNWHIEKDGVIIAKGNGILKYAESRFYQQYDIPRKQFDPEKQKKYDKFLEFIHKLDSTCGGMVGNATENYTYEKQIATEYKTENKVVEDTNGSIKVGQYFILKGSFNYGCSKGNVYVFEQNDFQKANGTFRAYRLNGKLTKVLKGKANSANTFGVYKADDKRFLEWIEKGYIAWCHIEEVKTPYEVEKVVKVKTGNSGTEKKTAQKAARNNTEKETVDNAEINDLTFTVREDTDTRNGDKIYLVKCNESLSKELYIKVNKYIKSFGGYYSKFKHAFLFKENPMEKEMEVQFV